jgi:hypothetical protein
MDRILALLDEYRKYPRFQLERHFDVILLEYIPSILNAYFKGKRKYSIAFPEFPVSKELLKQPYISKYESVSVDYIVFDKINRKFCFVELKTDKKSNNPTQDAYLKELKTAKYKTLIQFLCERIDSRKESWDKYQYLYNKMLEHDVISHSAQIEYNYTIDGVIKVVPKKSRKEKHKTIPFDKIVKYQIHDPGFSLIKKYLKKWADPPSSTIKKDLRVFANKYK